MTRGPNNTHQITIQGLQEWGMNRGETFVYDKAQMLGRETCIDCRGPRSGFQGSAGGAVSV